MLASGQKLLGKCMHPVGDRHLARGDECGEPREQPDGDQARRRRSSITPAAISNGGSGWTGKRHRKARRISTGHARGTAGPTTIRRMASSCGCQRESQVNSIAILPPSWSRTLSGPVQPPPSVRRVPCFASAGGVRRILGEQLARAVDHVDPVVERVRELGHQLLERPLLEAAALVEAVVGDMAEIGLGLLHHRHVEEHAGLADLVVGAEAADASRRGGDDRRRLLVEHALAIGPRADVDRVLEHAGNAAIIFGADEQHAVGRGDLLAEAGPLLGRIAVEVLVVERQVADLDHRAIEIVAAHARRSTARPCG